MEDARGEDDPERPGQTEHQSGQRAARKSHQNDRATAVAIGDASPDGRQEELHHRVGGEQRPDHNRRRPELLGPERKQGQDDAEPEQVDEHRQRDCRQRAARQSSAGG